MLLQTMQPKISVEFSGSSKISVEFSKLSDETFLLSQSYFVLRLNEIQTPHPLRKVCKVRSETRDWYHKFHRFWMDTGTGPSTPSRLGGPKPKRQSALLKLNKLKPRVNVGGDPRRKKSRILE